MLAKQRLAYIMKRLEEDAAISVNTLSKEMKISLSTVQRDLRKLQSEGKIERERGGALSNEFYETLTTSKERSTEGKEHVNAKQKDELARCASELIQDQACIYMDTGTTMAYMVPYIMNKDITIVTNSFYLVQKLKGCKAKLIVLGGEYNSKYDMSGGSVTLKELDSYRFDHCFISCNGFNVENKEVSCVDTDNGIVKEHAMHRSLHAHLLADASKLKVRATYTFATMKEFDTIFTDEKEGHNIQNIAVCKGEKR